MGYWQVKGAKNLDKLNYELRSTIMIRRLKEEVLTELPPKTRQVIELSTNSKIKKIIGSEKNIKKLQEDRIEELKAQIILSKASENKEEYKEAVKALRDVNTYIFEEIAELRSQLAEYKIPDVINHITELIENGIKVVSFGHHHTLMKAIQDHFGDICVSHNGKMSKEDKQDSVDRFQSHDSIRLFNGSIMASGVGITLTEGEVAVFNELDWRPSIVNQAEDRLVRIGQTKNVLVQYLVYEDSIDVELAKTIVDKQDIIDKALDSEISVEEQLLLNLEVGPAEVDTEVKTEPVNLSKKAINEEVKNIDSETIWDIGEALIGLSGLCDGAFQRDDLGFNLIDAKVGKSLAMSHQASGLTPKQAALGKAIIKKYKRQIPKSLYGRIFS
jgi:SNF2 family DNA or RNA helicase